MDASLYRAINRLAARTGWAHPLFIAYAKYGVVLFAVLLLAGWWLARSSADLDAVAVIVWAGAGAVLALGVGQLIGHGRALAGAAVSNLAAGRHEPGRAVLAQDE